MSGTAHSSLPLTATSLASQLTLARCINDALAKAVFPADELLNKRQLRDALSGLAGDYTRMTAPDEKLLMYPVLVRSVQPAFDEANDRLEKVSTNVSRPRPLRRLRLTQSINWSSAHVCINLYSLVYRFIRDRNLPRARGLRAQFQSLPQPFELEHSMAHAEARSVTAIPTLTLELVKLLASISSPPRNELARGRAQGPPPAGLSRRRAMLYGFA